MTKKRVEQAAAFPAFAAAQKKWKAQRLSAAPTDRKKLLAEYRTAAHKLLREVGLRR